MLANAVRPKQVALGRYQCATVLTTICCSTIFRRVLTTSSTTQARARHIILEGRQTNVDQRKEDEQEGRPQRRHGPYQFETGFSIFAKRPSRPFPPPFVSAPSGSFSDPLTTHDRVRHRQPTVDGHVLGGTTNGDDAILVGNGNFLVVNDGVGAWAQKQKGHAALWSRLIAHFWWREVEQAYEVAEDHSPELSTLKTIEFLQTAYENTKRATKTQNSEIMGTTTASAALLHHDVDTKEAVVLTTQLGDCAVYIIRPPSTPPAEFSPDSEQGTGDEENDAASILEKATLYKTKEQWHWFDCPRQLGTNSPDTPDTIAVMDTISVQPADIVVCMSDGVTDNLWEHEIVAKILTTWFRWGAGKDDARDGVVYMARELMDAARVVAQDPSAESPYMERALDEGIAAEGGKLDDISVVIGIVRRSEDANVADQDHLEGPHEVKSEEEKKEEASKQEKQNSEDKSANNSNNDHHSEIEESTEPKHPEEK